MTHLIDDDWYSNLMKTMAARGRMARPRPGPFHAPTYSSTTSMPGEKRFWRLAGRNGVALYLDILPVRCQWINERGRPRSIRGGSGTSVEGGRCRRQVYTGESGRCQDENGVYPFDSLMAVSQQQPVSLSHPVQGTATHPQEHGGLSPVACRLF
jgi:hypothetical protein